MKKKKFILFLFLGVFLFLAASFILPTIYLVRVLDENRIDSRFFSSKSFGENIDVYLEAAASTFWAGFEKKVLFPHGRWSDDYFDFDSVLTSYFLPPFRSRKIVSYDSSEGVAHTPYESVAEIMVKDEKQFLATRFGFSSFAYEDLLNDNENVSSMYDSLFANKINCENSQKRKEFQSEVKYEFDDLGRIHRLYYGSSRIVGVERNAKREIYYDSLSRIVSAKEFAYRGESWNLVENMEFHWNSENQLIEKTKFNIPTIADYVIYYDDGNVNFWNTKIDYSGNGLVKSVKYFTEYNDSISEKIEENEQLSLEYDSNNNLIRRELVDVKSDRRALEELKYNRNKQIIYQKMNNVNYKQKSKYKYSEDGKLVEVKRSNYIVPFINEDDRLKKIFVYDSLNRIKTIHLISGSFSFTNVFRKTSEIEYSIEFLYENGKIKRQKCYNKDNELVWFVNYNDEGEIIYMAYMVSRICNVMKVIRIEPLVAATSAVRK